MSDKTLLRDARYALSNLEGCSQKIEDWRKGWLSPELVVRDIEEPLRYYTTRLHTLLSELLGAKV